MSIDSKKIDFDPNELSKKGLELFDQGDFEEALQIFEKLNKFFPNNLDLLNLLGYIFLQLENFDQSIKAYSNSLKINPNLPGVYFNRAIAYNKYGDKIKALKDYDQALKLDPYNLDIYQNRSLIYEDLGDFDRALEQINYVIEKNPKNPLALTNRGNIYQRKFEFNLSKQDYIDALAISPNNSNILKNLANVLKNLKQYLEAEKIFLKALKFDIENDSIHFNYSLLILFLKKFNIAWDEYEYRSSKKKIFDNLNNLKECKNINSPNEKILIWGEQGIGDQIIYSSMLGSLPKENNLTIALDQRLVPIFRRSFDFLNFISFEEAKELNINFFDSQLALGSLGKFYRRNLEDFKNLPKSFLVADLNRSKRIRENLKIKNKKICGISWKSKNEEVGFAKSLKLEDMVDLLSMDDFTFVDLQYGDTDAEKNLLKEKFDININAIEGLDKFNDIDGLLSLIEACDLIVTSSNVTAHLAGAIGKKTFLMAPESLGSLWYWHDDKQSIWYQSVTLYRKKISVGWEHVVKKIIKDIH